MLYQIGGRVAAEEIVMNTTWPALEAVLGWLMPWLWWSLSSQSLIGYDYKNLALMSYDWRLSLPDLEVSTRLTPAMLQPPPAN